MRSKPFGIFLLFFYFAPLPLYAQTSPLALRGTVLTPDGPLEQGTVLIENGKITAVGANLKLPTGTETIETGGIIAPGLIDLHNHLTWNIFPRWKPAEQFKNRYEWQQRIIYQMSMEVPHGALAAEGHDCDMEIYAEVKAITEGETSAVGGTSSPCHLHLVRTLDNDPRLPDNSTPHVLYNIFPLQMSETQVAEAEKALHATPHGYLIVHLSEGAANDASAAREFPMFKERGLLLPGVSLIHGVALKAPDFAELHSAGVGFIWSPRSNIELYGATADVVAANAAHVTIALAPDWSPTGSVGLLSELHYAATWNQAQHTAEGKSPFSDRELLAMATSNAASLVGLDKQIGSIAPGYAADLIVVQPAKEPGVKDVYWSLTHATPADLQLVVIGGIKVYGKAEWMGSSKNQALKICETQKKLATALLPETKSNFAAIEEDLDAALRHWGRKLAPLAECGE